MALSSRKIKESSSKKRCEIMGPFSIRCQLEGAIIGRCVFKYKSAFCRLLNSPKTLFGAGFNYVQWLPSISLLLSISISFWIEKSATHLPFVIFGTYTSWIYLRFWQRKPETKLKGDPSEDFAFSTFFPELVRPVIDPVASIFHRMLCGRSEASNESQGYTLGGSSLPGSDPIEASRRRERGARALEERLAAERLAAAHGTEESGRDAAENV
nr:rhomboid-like protein 19 [Malus domestica]